MKAEFTALVQQLIAAQGRDALFNTAKCKAFLATAQGANISEKRLLQQVVESGITSGIANARDIAAYKSQAVQKLQADYFLAPNVASGAVDVLIGLIRAAPPTPVQQKKNTSPMQVQQPVQKPPVQQPISQSPIQQATYQTQQSGKNKNGGTGMFCSNCGTQINTGVQFCPKCGTQTNSSSNVQKHEIVGGVSTSMFVVIGVTVSFFLTVYTGFLYFLIISAIYPQEKPFKNAVKITGIIALCFTGLFVSCLLLINH
jgi:hypothetical protein